MKTNYPIVVLVLVAVLALIAYPILRNGKDKQRFEDETYNLK